MADRLGRFLRALHRRLVLLRLVEGIGLGVLGGCVPCLAVVPVLIHRGEAVWGAVGTLLGVGALIGIAWTALRPPRLMEAAGMADSQLRLADLLTSAWMVRGRDDDMSRAVVAMAEQRAAALSVNDVLLNRLGRRTWGSIGLAAALVVSMALLSANPIETSASEGSPRMPTAIAQPRNPGEQGQLAKHAARVPGIIADQPNERSNALDPAQNTETGPDGKATDNNGGPATANPDGTGGGAGRSRPKDAATPPTIASTGATVTNNRPDAPTASGTAQGNPGGREGATGQTAGHAKGPAAAPPWTAPNWGQSRDAAESALRQGAVPPEYHDLIRAYFDRK